MADIRTLRSDVEPHASYLLKVLRENGIMATVTSARRGRAKQAALFRAFQRGQSRFPAAPPGTSTHEQGLAFDLHVTPRSRLAEIGRLWESWGFTWGGRFKDPIHFDFRPHGSVGGAVTKRSPRAPRRRPPKRRRRGY